MTTGTKTLAIRIRGLLDQLVACRHLSNDEQEVVMNEVAAEARKLPRQGVLEARPFEWNKSYVAKTVTRLKQADLTNG